MYLSFNIRSYVKNIFFSLCTAPYKGMNQVELQRPAIVKAVAIVNGRSRCLSEFTPSTIIWIYIFMSVLVLKCLYAAVLPE